MPKLALSRCAYLLAAFGLIGGLLVAGPGWRVRLAGIGAELDPSTLGVLAALILAALGGGTFLMLSWFAAPRIEVPPTGRTHDTGTPHRAPAQVGKRDEADAVGAAVRIFRDGLHDAAARGLRTGLR